MATTRVRKVREIVYPQNAAMRDENFRRMHDEMARGSTARWFTGVCGDTARGRRRFAGA
jgi:hypothetical protein